MAMVMDQQQTYKHYCRICKRGFGCGRALGGHMRAHGINDDQTAAQADVDDDPSSAYGSEWDDKLNPPSGSKRMYALRTNPNRLKTCRSCENCGKEFLSWKSFLEHGKCSLEEEADESMISSPPRSDGGDDGDDDDQAGRRGGSTAWSKGKRSRRAKMVCNLNLTCPSSEEEDLANCLVMLSAARVDHPMAVVETEESCASASREEDRRNPIDRATIAAAKAPATTVPRGMFECKACKKVFTSHQALGGHRASHKKVKGCFAAKLDNLDEYPPEEEVTVTHDHDNHISDETGKMAIVPFDHQTPLAMISSSPLKKKSKVHECSICHRVFSSGQALGGHKRCHWITSNSAEPAAVSKLHHQMIQEHPQHDQDPLVQLRPIMFEKSKPLDLNLPAPADELRQELETTLSIDVSAALYLQQPWIDTKNNNNNPHNNNNNNENNTNSNNANTSALNADDEADSKIKLAKLSDLKDLDMDRGSSPWLQVGIGSSANGSNDI